ncbi:MAG: hypothetical protein KAV00_09775 [Phycisphaerae bacterium]|nr:hypothetical protein [Phycisphaerae bacterium]
MSLINEALKRAEVIGQNTKTPDAKRSTHGIEHLYDDHATGRKPPPVAVTEEISRLLRKDQTSLRGASALGVCVIASVAVIMHLTLPSEQRSPVEAEAGGATATLETQTPTADEKTEAAPDETPEKSTVAALQHAIAGVLNPSTAKTPENTPPPEPVETIQPDTDERNIDDKPEAVKFTLSGILASGNKGYAIVNNQMVTVGDNIDGAKVITIGKHHVVLEKDSKQFTLRM